MNQFKIGDTVRLKSGGPVMTINELKMPGRSEGLFKCKWFYGTQLKSGEFHKDTLDMVDKASITDIHM